MTRQACKGRAPCPGVVYVVHYAHVLAMAWLVGGPAAAWLTRASRLRTFEGVTWAAFGVIVATGVGNVGALGDGLPGLASTWGMLLLAKLVLVLVLAGLSLRRSVLAWRGTPSRRLYGVTALLAAVIGAMGVWLAHG